MSHPCHLNHSIRKTSLLTLIAFGTLLGSADQSQASALWGVVPGRVLASAGKITVVKEKADLWNIEVGFSKVSSPIEGTYLNTSQSGQGIFFGTIGNSVTISRKGQDGAGGTWSLGQFNSGLKTSGGIRDGKAWREDDWSHWRGKDRYGVVREQSQKICTNCLWQYYPAEGDQKPYAHGAEHNFVAKSKEVLGKPSFMLAQNSIVTKVWECVPTAVAGYYPMFSGGTGANWHANPEPVINAVGNFTEDGKVTPVSWSMTGWWQGAVNVTGTDEGPVYSGKSYNNVTLVDAMAMWPCDMLTDFYVPGGEMSIASQSGSENVTVRWDAQYDCGVPMATPVVGEPRSTPTPTPTPTPPPTPTPAPDKGAVFYWNASRAPGQVFNVVQNQGLLREGSDVRNFNAVIAQLKEAGIGAVEAALQGQGATRYPTTPYQWKNSTDRKWTSQWVRAEGSHAKYLHTRYHTLTTYYWHKEYYSIGNAIVMVDPDLGSKPITLSTREWGTIMAAIQKAEREAAVANQSLQQARDNSELSKKELDRGMDALAKAQSGFAKLETALRDREASQSKLSDMVEVLDRESADLAHALDVLERQTPRDMAAETRIKDLQAKNKLTLETTKGELNLLLQSDKSARVAVAEAKAMVDAAIKDLADKISQHAKNQFQTDAKQGQYDAAKRNADNPTVTLGGETAALSKEAREKGVAEAQVAADKARAAAEKVEATAGAQIKVYNDLVSKADAARAQLERLTSGDVKLETVLDDLMIKTQAHADAITAMAAAKDVTAGASTAVSDAAKKLVVANAELSSAEKNLGTAQTAYDNAVSDFGSNSDQAQAAKSGLDKAEGEMSSAKKAVSTATQQKTATETARDAAAGTQSTATKDLAAAKAAMDQQSELAEGLQSGALGAAAALGEMELKIAKMDVDVIKSIEQVNAARRVLDDANGLLSEQKFWANSKTGSYTTSIAGVIGARTDNEVQRYTTTTTLNQDYVSKIQSPVTISFDGMGDFLAGSDNWRKEESRVPRLSAMRSINLDTEGAKMWEWIGPTEGLLVWNPDGERVFQPTGAEFFGNWTWGKSWSDGYKPLQALDKNKDGVLGGEELRGIWVWVDANSDAIVQLGELNTLAEAGIDSLSVNYKTDDRGGMWIPEGASGPRGKFPTRDWWSVGGMSYEDYDGLVDLVRETPSMWVWEPNTPTGEDQGGGLNFYASEDYGMIALSIPRKDVYAIKFAELIGAKDPQQAKTQIVFNVRVLGQGVFQWEADLGFGKLSTVVEQKGEETIDGATKVVSYENPEEKSGTIWTGQKVSGPSLDQIADVARVTPGYNR